MTTIAAVQGDGWAVVGFDSRVTEDGRVFSLPAGSGKVVERGAWLLGAAGDMRAINLVSHILKPPSPPHPGASREELDSFFATKFVPALKNCFDQAQYGEKGEQDSQVIAVVSGVVYVVGSSYDWAPDASGLYALGSGGDYALGSMARGEDRRKNRTPQASREAVKRAVEIAARFDADTGLPVRVLTQTVQRS
jgi:ATP-dependent protease HslVU (ClpYQ) peptidase subunit